MCFWDGGVKLLLHEVIGGFWMFSLSRVELKLFTPQASPTKKRSSIYHWTDPIEQTSCFVRTFCLQVWVKPSVWKSSYIDIMILESPFLRECFPNREWWFPNLKHFRYKTSEKIKTWILALSPWPTHTSNCPLKQLSNGYNLWLLASQEKHDQLKLNWWFGA